MFKLIIIFAMFGNGVSSTPAGNTGISISQQEYRFNTVGQCEYVRDFYRANLHTFMESRYNVTRLSAECFKE